MTLQTFEELKLSGNLPTPAGVGMRILQLTRTEEYSAEEMGEAIMADSALTARVLRLANSAARTGREPATTVEAAIMRLGGSTVRDMALAFSLVSERGVRTCSAFDYQLYWSRSLARAVAAQALSQLLELRKPEEAYICGLLGDLGRLALASVYPDHYAKVLRACGHRGLDELLSMETSVFHINHSQITGSMLREWGLPEFFCESVEEYSRSQELQDGGEQITSLGMLLRYADVVAETCTLDDTASDWTWSSLGERLECLRATCSMQPHALQLFVEDCASEWRTWGESLDIPTSDEDLRFSTINHRLEEATEAVTSGRAVEPEAADQEPLPEEEDLEADEDHDGGQGGDQNSDIDVLVVDDDSTTLRLLAAHMKRNGYAVEMARDGDAALKAVLNSPPDIVVADWQMPKMDGLELCRALRRSRAGANIFFLLLTGSSEDSTLIEAFDAGVDDFVTKPFSPRLLSARIKGGVRLAILQRKVEADRQTMIKQVAELQSLTRQLRAAALTDSLTELPNRRYAMRRMQSEWSSTLRTKRPLTLMMLDIDRFKLVNDQHGHDVGDVVLQETAKVLQEAVRGSDEVCRLGGEEFLILARNTSEADAMVLAERVRAIVEANVIEGHGLDRAVTMSIGVAASDGADHPAVDSLLKLADEAVYLAKDSGRNRVCSAAELRLQRKSA